MPKISVIMPVYNGIKYIQESIASIQSQTFKDWELLIINEYGSNDGTKEYAESCAQLDKRIVLIQNDVKMGLAASLNKGISLAKGEYIARADVDDPSYPNRFKLQLSFMEKNPEVGLCGTMQRSVTATGSNIQLAATSKEELPIAMLFGCEITHSAVMFRRELFQTKKWFYRTDCLCEDYELWTRIMFETPIANLNEVLVDHRWGFDNISIQKGEKLREATREIAMKAFERLGINANVEGFSPYLFSNWNSKPVEYATANRTEFLKDGYRLLKRLEEQNEKLGVFCRESLEKIIMRRWNWICECCGMKFNSNTTNINKKTQGKYPLVSVVMPIYNSASYLREAVDSVIEQTYHNWELLLVNEYGSDDGSAEICKMYQTIDSRVRLIQNEEKLGLAESLNLGFREAKGTYVARLDADDLAHPERLRKQVNFLEKNKQIGILGTWQHHFGPKTNWNHTPPASPKQLKANLLFYCDMCHSTVMLRKAVIEEHQLYYNPHFLAEDFELWSRAVRITGIATLPEVLGEYRWGEDNITLSKQQKLREESGRLVAENIKSNLGLIIPDEQHYLLAGWGNVYEEVGAAQRAAMAKEFRGILMKIWETNQEKKVYDEQALLNIINAKWKWAVFGRDWRHVAPVYCIGRVFDEEYPLTFKIRVKKFLGENPGIFKKARAIVKKMASPILRRINDRQEHMKHYIDDTSWKYVSRLEHKLDAKFSKCERMNRELSEEMAETNFRNNRISLLEGEKIRILFIFQVASFWPSMDYFYRACREDSSIDAKILCYDLDYDASIKTETAREYLDKNGYEYEPYEKFVLSEFNPHVVVMQTAYDTNRETKYTTLYLKNRGHRVVYIPYGIEIADTKHAREAHFETAVPRNCWRLFTFSETMADDYRRYCKNSDAVRVCGLPKFDALYYREQFELDKEIIEKAEGRKIVLWKVHFPKVIKENGENILVTPYIQEYIAFAHHLSQYSDLFFVFMPHPRFKEFNDDKYVKEQLENLYGILQKNENVYIDESEDYRNSLMNSDYIIVDRSAVMVEAGAIGVPVLYMYNPDFEEPVTKAIQPLMDSYYSGTSCADMLQFINQCLNDLDPKKTERQAAFDACIPYFDGACGERIKKEIISEIME